MASEWVKEYTTSDLDDLPQGLVLVDFWAPWCGPCRMMAPIVEQLAADLAGKLTVAKVNIDENGQAAVDNAIASIPTLILFKDGGEVERLIGARPKAELLDVVQKYL